MCVGKRLKIGYFADGLWGHNAFHRIVSDETLEIVFLTVRYDNQDPVLIQHAKAYNIPLAIESNINTEYAIKRFKSFNADLFVSMSFNQIFRKDILKVPPLKTINCHAGKLPYYRGRNILNWALINDEKEFGITIHYVDEGIDTGDIILQRTFLITDEDNYSTLLERAYTGCADILYDAIKLIQSGSVKTIRQDTIDKIGMYCGIRKKGDEIINWNSTSREIFNFVRALCKPGPMASSTLNGKEIWINKVREIDGAKKYINTPGQILGKTDRGFYVKTKDTFVEVVEFKYSGKIRVGDRLI